MSALDEVYEFDDLSKRNQLIVIYRTILSTKGTVMALADQIATLTARVSTVEDALVSLGQKVDAEQVQVNAAIGLLSADNPDLATAITKLEGVATNLGAIQADVESTIPDTPPTP